ncbi:DUF3601 domain-containing protein [Hymenobacter sp. BT559]|uniref:DUF3601 domain-containing protein n=1 Tax=Hymenobacter sp. BT559 TaxID=2795729 RepID=UPI0018EB9F9D|nr:DUF3601 domain-containing protein [Hymenobacter sp. BT559]MBJ6144779.1 DUF3601 domain-containing protein [Hymenobacter sp. BT559]
MAAIRTLVAGQKYCVVQQFVDYDQQVHPVGETWVFEGTNFVPYEDGLTLHVLVYGVPQVYRFQWRPEEQAALIENFTDFVAAR